MMNTAVKTVLITLLAVGFLVIMGLTWGVGQYNKVVAMDEQVKSRWAQVENELRRRYDLVPQLVAAIKVRAKHEEELFITIEEARIKYIHTSTVKDKIQSSRQMEGLLSRLLKLTGNYPQLNAKKSFLKLQDSLGETGHGIAIERKRYNDEAQTLNAYRQTVIGRLFASVTNVGEAPYFKFPAEEKEAAAVKS